MRYITPVNVRLPAVRAALLAAGAALLPAAWAGPGGVPAVVRLPAPHAPAAQGGPVAHSQAKVDYRPGPMATAMAAAATPGGHGAATDLPAADPALTDPPPSRSLTVAGAISTSATVTITATATASITATHTATATASPTATRTPTPWPPTATPSPTPTLSAVQAIRATWTAEAATPTTPTTTPIPRPVRARRSSNAADLLAPDSLPRTMAGVHFAGPEVRAGELWGGEEMTGWAVEVAYASDDQFEDLTAAHLVDLHRRGFRVILRLDYSRGQHIPPLYDPSALERYVATFVRYYELTGGRVKYFVVGNEGNVDEPTLDPGRLTECRAGPDSCEPEAYALVYRAVRRALRAQTDAYALVGAVSPGGAANSPRWMDGSTYLAAALNRLHPSEVDGIALHAYAPAVGPDAGQVQAAVDYFVRQLAEQIEVARQASYLSTPLFITEMNQQGRPAEEFIRGVYRWIDNHNRQSRQDIVAACWFVFHDRTGAWSQVALSRWSEALAVFAEAGVYPPGR